MDALLRTRAVFNEHSPTKVALRMGGRAARGNGAAAESEGGGGGSEGARGREKCWDTVGRRRGQDGTRRQRSAFGGLVLHD